MTSRTVDISTVASASDYCSYPMWTIPGTGDGRCDWNIGCPMVPEAKCDDVETIAKGDTCNIACLNNAEWIETWECVGGEEWVRLNEDADCLRDIREDEPDDVIIDEPDDVIIDVPDDVVIDVPDDIPDVPDDIPDVPDDILVDVPGDEGSGSVALSLSSIAASLIALSLY